MTTQPTISIIVAVAADGAIGRRGDLAFHIREDLRRFKQITMGKPLVMGRRTFESLPGGALPGRRNIVVTRDSSFSAPGAERAASLGEAISMAAQTAADGAGEIMIIGGGQIYAEAIGMADRLYLTEIDATVDDADTFFPAIDRTAWEQTEQSPLMTDPRSSVGYRFTTLDRKK